MKKELGKKTHTLGSKTLYIYGFLKLFLINNFEKLFFLLWQKLKGEKYPFENGKQTHKTQIPFDLDEELGEKKHTLGSKT